MRSVDPNQIVVHERDRYRRQYLGLLAEDIGQSSRPAIAHSDVEVLPFGVARRNVFYFRIARSKLTSAWVIMAGALSQQHIQQEVSLMRSTIAPALLAAICLTAASPEGSAWGGVIYSVNVQTDELVAIETTTGAVTTIGSIGHQMQGTDLASLNGLVYATTQKVSGFNLNGMTLVAINPVTGAKVSSADMLFGTNQVFAEGLTAADGQLIATFDYLSTVSPRSGVVDPVTGAISDQQHHGPDLDELGTTHDGRIIAVDGINFSGNTRQMAFYELERNPTSTTFLGDFLMQGSLDDIVFTPFGAFSLDHTAGNLYQIDISGPSIVATIPIGAIGLQLDGLAFIPEPSAVVLEALGFVALVMVYLRRRAGLHPHRRISG